MGNLVSDEHKIETETQKQRTERVATALTEIISPRKTQYISELNEALTTELTASNVVFIQESSVWDNDAAEVSTRPGAKSFKSFGSNKIAIVPVGSQTITNPDIPESGIMIRAKGKIAVGKPIGEPIVKVDWGTEIRYFIREAVEADTEETFEFRTKDPEDAEKLWHHINLGHMYPERFVKAYQIAQEVIESNRKWKEAFPEISPGDMAELSSKFQIDTYNTSWYRTNPEGIAQMIWEVPHIFELPLDEALLQRRAQLEAGVKAGDAKCIEICQHESTQLLKQDLWETFADAVGHPMNPRYSIGEDYWDTERFTGSPDLEDFFAYVVNEKGEEIEVARAKPFQNVGYNPTPTYRVYTDKDNLHPPLVYKPDSVKWKKAPKKEIQ